MPIKRLLASAKMWWLTWRARLSIPSILATWDEQKVISLVTGVNGALAILTVCLLAWITGLPHVFPALGPTAFILFSKPFSPDAAPRSVILGHFSGIVCGIAVCQFFSCFNDGPVSLDVIGWPTLASASAALAMTSFTMVRLSCPHAPACASALIVAVGGASGWINVVAMAIAVVVISGQGYVIYRMGGVKTPAWAPEPRSIR